MTDHTATHPTPTAQVPFTVRLFGPMLNGLLKAGVPIGYNRLVTIRGRRSGLPRTAALAVLEISGRRWVWAPWGEVNWVKNLRAAGRATVRKDGHDEEVCATELSAQERIAFFRDTLGPFASSITGGTTFFRLVDGVDLRDPVAAAQGRSVFELYPAR